MTLNSVILIDHEDHTASRLSSDLQSLNVDCIRATGSDDACLILHLEPSVSLAIIRCGGPDLDGVDLCRRIRSLKTAQQLPILVILQDSQLEQGPQALEAGATDIVVAPFCTHELLLRAGYDRNGERRRIDSQHPDTADRTAIDSPTVVTPWFDRGRMKFTYDADIRQLKNWDHDECVDKSIVDVLMVCPECESVPTFRYGCQNCGSALMKRERLIHHYKCAHVATESDFHSDKDLICPKCHTVDLVAGVDFEHVYGSYCCSDCRTAGGDLKLIGHCLNCQHRFPASDAALRTLVAYRLPQSPDATRAASPTPAQIAAAQWEPWFQRQQSREQPVESS